MPVVNASSRGAIPRNSDLWDLASDGGPAQLQSEEKQMEHGCQDKVVDSDGIEGFKQEARGPLRRNFREELAPICKELDAIRARLGDREDRIEDRVRAAEAAAEGMGA